MKRRGNQFILCVMILCVTFFGGFVNSEESAIDAGLRYLSQSQNSDGSWGKQLDLQATAFAIVALESSGESCAADKSHLAEKEFTTAYELAIQLLGTKQGAVAQKLLALQKTDGSWDDLHTTALALIVLQRLGQTNPTAVTYLKNKQNSDGSWGLQGTNEITAMVVYALSLAGESGNEIARGLTWLAEHQAPQGSWNNITATAWSILALKQHPSYGSSVTKATQYLRSQQFPNYGWGLGKEPIAAVYPTALTMWALATVYPEETAIDNGLTYLQTQRYNAVGWYNQELGIPTTLLVAEAFTRLGRNDGLVKAGQWIQAVQPRNTGSIAARLSYLTKYAPGSPEEQKNIQAALLARQNTDGGWGSGLGYESDLLDTSLVLRAIWDAQNANSQVYQKALSFIQSRQRADGGFNLNPTEQGQVYLTAHLILTLEKLKPLVPADAVIASAATWLIAQKKMDGSWGQGVLDTGMTLLAVGNRLSAEELTAVRTYIESRQQTNGSWEKDDLTTVIAVLALNKLKPNLILTPNDIIFNPVTAFKGDDIAINVNVRNIGLSADDNIAVRLYQGDPTEGTLLDTQTLLTLPAKGNAVVNFTWNASTTGKHEFTAVVDPENKIGESDESDNQGGKLLNVVPKVDLVLVTGDVINTPEDPGPTETLTLKARVRNLGYADSGAFEVAFYNGDPQAGGVLLGTVDCPNISGQELVEVIYNTTLPEGDYQIYAVADPENLVNEDDKENNRTFQGLKVEKRVDLAISYNNIVFSKDAPMEGDRITIYATVTNKREEPVTNVPVAFYLGNPATDGQLLGTVTLSQVAGNSTALATLDWDTTGITGRQLIYVVVDPEGAIREVDKTNNQALQVIYVTVRPDLTGSVSASTMTEGIPGNISISIKNQGGCPAGNVKVRIFLGEPSSGRQLCNDVIISELAAGNTQYINVALDTVNRAGTHSVSVWVDPENIIDEPNETNNQFSTTFIILPSAELAITEPDFTCSQSLIDEGDRVTFNAIVKNTTSTSANNAIFRFYRYNEENGWEVLEEQKATIAGNQQKTLSFTWDSDYHLGTNSFKFIIDPDGNIYERNKANNVIAKDFQVRAAQMPDLTVDSESIVTAPLLVASGTECLLRAVVENLRTVAANNALVRFYDGDPAADGVVIGEQIINVPGRGSTTVEVTWDTSNTKGHREIYVWVDPKNAIEEYHEDNNVAQKLFSLRADLSYQPQNLRASVDYQDVSLSWDPVDQPDVLGYLAYRNGSLLNRSFIGSHGMVTASSTYSTSSSYAPSNAIDGNSNTYWHSRYAVSHWFEEEFADYQFVKEIEIIWSNGNQPENFQVQIWIEGHYQTVARVSGNTNNEVICKLGIDGMLIRKYRIVMSRPNNYYSILREITIHAREFSQALSYPDMALPSGNYEYTVTALNSQGEESLPSASALVSILPPATPAGFKAEVQGPEVQLSWERSTSVDCQGYYLARNGEILGETETVSGEPSAFTKQNNSYGPEKAVDGNESTFWYYVSTTSPTGWWQFSLPLRRYISKIIINWQYTPVDFEILYWQNNTWVKITEVRNNQQALNEVDLNGVYKTDKIRVNILKPYTSGNNYYFGIKEVYISSQKLLDEPLYNDNLLKAGTYQYTLTSENSLACESNPVQLSATVNPPEQPTDVSVEVNEQDAELVWNHRQEKNFAGYYIERNGQLLSTSQAPVDVAVSGKASASSCYSTSISYQPSNALDRNLNTHWYSAANVFPIWYTVQLSSVKVISGVGFAWYSSSYSAKDFLIQYQQDGKWFTIQRIIGAYETESTYAFPHAVKTDAIRLYCTSGNSSYLIIRELYIYENLPLSEKTYLDSDLSEGNYDYTIIAADYAGNWSKPSVPATATVGTVPVPQNLQATVEDTSVSLQWEMLSMENVAGFRVYRDYREINEPQNIAGSCTVQVSANSGFATRINDNNASTYWYQPYRTYPATVEMTSTQTMELYKIGIQWYSAAAKDYNVLAMVDGSWTTIREIRDNTQLYNEIDLTGELATSQIKLEILSGPNYVYLAELQLFNLNLVKVQSFRDSILENRIYSYYVKAVSSENAISGASNIVDVTVDEKTPPSPPTGFTIVEQNNSLLLQWTPNSESDMAGYNLYLGSSVQPLNNSLLTTNQYTYSLPFGVSSFDFKLYAVDINDNRSAPATASFTFSKPLAPTNVKAVTDKRNISLTWSPSTSLSIQGYKVYRNGSLVNKLTRVSPAMVSASSLYCNNSYYRPENASDQNISTFWRPGLTDPSSYLEINYSSLRYISAIEIGWHDINERPLAYTVEAWINGSWQPVLTNPTLVQQTVILASVVATDRLRLVIKETDGLISLSEFNGYTANWAGTTFTDQNLASGVYQYQVTAVNIAGLESVKSPAVGAEITTRDVAVLTGDVYFSPYNPSVFDNITISVNVKNTGAVDVAGVSVVIYIGDPNAGGSRIASLTTSAIKPGDKSLVQYVWDPTGFTGEQQIFAVADPEGLIPEYDETNNMSSRNIVISSFSKLETSVANIESSGFPNIKLGVQVNDTLGEGVAGLRKENFSIEENGIEQQILSVISKIEEGTELAKIDLVFIVDTSGSMNDEWNLLPQILVDLTDLITKMGIDLEYKIYSLQRQVYLSDLPTELLNKGIFKGQFMDLSTIDCNYECWGPATAWVAENYAWRNDSFRIVVPISDEACFMGSDTNDWIDDEYSINEATNLCKENQVEAYPFYGELSGYIEEVKREMQILAQGTGGEMFFFQDASQVVNYLSRVLSRKKVHYTIEYSTSNQTKDGTLRTVTVDSSYRHATGTCEGQYRAPQDTYCDLSFASFDTEPIHSENQPVNLRATVQNGGGIPAENVQVDVYLGNPANGGVCLSSTILEMILPNSAVTLDIPWITAPGKHQFYAFVDPVNQITELNEGNNIITLEVQVPGTQRPDLAIFDQEVELSSTTPSCGQRVEIKARVHNLGSASGTFNVGFYQGNPQAGGKLIETRKVSSLNYLGYQDLVCSWITGIRPETVDIYVVADPLNLVDEVNETNNQAVKNVQITERSISGGITTDKPGYNPNENVLFSLTVTNRQPENWTGKAGVVIKDLQNHVIKELPKFEIDELLGDAGNGPGIWNQAQVWNIGGLAPGNYLACLELYENDDRFAEFHAEFEVYADRQINGILNTNKAIYAPNEQAVITVDYTNASVNANLENLTVKVRVLGQAGEIWSEETPIGGLPLSGLGTSVFHWPIATDAIGNYQVIAEITHNTVSLWSSNKQVQVDPKVALIGTLSVNPKEGRKGDAIGLSYTVRNRGNVSIQNAPVKILFVEPKTETVVQEIIRMYSLGLDEEKSETITEIVQLEDDQYMVVLQANVEGKTIPLSSSALLVDSTPPVTSAEFSECRLQKDGVQYGVLRSKLTLQAADNLSGVAETLVDIGNGYQVYSGPLSFPIEGQYTVKYKSKDRLGNEEIEKEVKIVIDETPPVVVINSPVDGQEVSPEFTISLVASDNVALDHYELYINGQKYADYIDSPAEQPLKLQPGNYTLKARAVDKAEYEAWSALVNITVVNPDATPPVTVAQYPADWVNTDVTVILTATDDVSGVMATYYRIDNGEWQIGNRPTLQSEGIHTVEFYSVDQVDNTEAAKDIFVRIDKTAPQTRVDISGTQCGGGSYEGSVDIAITAQDQTGLSGVAVIYYRWGLNGTVNTYQKPFTLNNPGKNVLYYWAVDNAGNIENVSLREIIITENGWEATVSLLTKGLYVTGNVKVDSAFSNGPVDVRGNSSFNYLGTTQKSITKKGNVKIKQLETNKPYQNLPEPDWQDLDAATMLCQDARISGNRDLTNVRFNKNVHISGNVTLTGLLVVHGDLTISGNVLRSNVGIFCTGTVTVSGNTKINGLIYAGAGLKTVGNAGLNGVVIVNGRADIAGNVSESTAEAEDYFVWLRK